MKTEATELLKRSVTLSFIFLCCLYFKTGISFSDFIRSVLADYAPAGLTSRFPGVSRIPRSKLCALGPNYQHHADGHEKLNAQTLNTGGVGLNVYSIKDQWTSYIFHLVVVPNNRLATTIGHRE
jgi:hypothetical protein